MFKKYCITALPVYVIIYYIFFNFSTRSKWLIITIHLSSFYIDDQLLKNSILDEIVTELLP